MSGKNYYIESIITILSLLKDVRLAVYLIITIMLIGLSLLTYHIYFLPQAIIKYQVANDLVSKNIVISKRKQNFNKLIFQLRKLHNKKQYYGSALEFHYHKEKPYQEHSWCLVVHDSFKNYAQEFINKKQPLYTPYFDDRVIGINATNDCKEFILKEGNCDDKFHLTPTKQIYEKCQFIHDECIGRSVSEQQMPYNAAIMCVGNKNDFNDCYIILDGDEAIKYNPFNNGSIPTKKLLCDYIANN
jgi:hypothetical protein